MHGKVSSSSGSGSGSGSGSSSSSSSTIVVVVAKTIAIEVVPGAVAGTVAHQNEELVAKNKWQ